MCFRIVRQLLTESILLAFTGAGFGLLLGMAALSLFKSMLPPSTPGLSSVEIDWPVMVFVALLALVTGVAFGIAPALSAAQVDLTESIKTGSQRSTAGVWTAVRSWLIVGEVALTLVLVVSAGLLMKSLLRLADANPGFDAAHILSVQISPNQTACTERAACVALYDRIVAQARRMAGVREVAVVNTIPLDGELPTIPVDVEGHPKSADYPAPMLWAGAVSPEYLRMLHIPLLAGRQFTEADSVQAAKVLIITPATARRFWPGQNPIGKRPAPRAVRNAISLRRAVARESRRLATFAHAIKRTRPTEESRMINLPRTSPVKSCCMEIAVALAFQSRAMGKGNSLRTCAASPGISARACATVAPGRNLAINGTYSPPQYSSILEGSKRAGVHNCTLEEG
jgi:MacB-like periplasmic core domain